VLVLAIYFFEGYLHRVIGHGVGILFAYYLNRYIKSANTQKIVMAIEVKII